MRELQIARQFKAGAHLEAVSRKAAEIVLLVVTPLLVLLAVAGAAVKAPRRHIFLVARAAHRVSSLVEREARQAAH
jgi:hypothetical protein